MSIRARIALFGLGVVTAVLAAFCALVFLLLAAGVPDTQDGALADRAEQAADGPASCRRRRCRCRPGRPIPA